MIPAPHSAWRMIASGAFASLVAPASPAVAESIPAPGETSILTCKTSAVGLTTNPFTTTAGEIRIRIRRGTSSTDGEAPGDWTVEAADPAHSSAFAIRLGEECPGRCLFRIAESGSLELWSPKPMGLDGLAEGETLLVATIDPKSLELKASAFRGKELSGLERGECRLEPTAASGSDAAPGERPSPPPIAAPGETSNSGEPRADKAETPAKDNEGQ